MEGEGGKAARRLRMVSAHLAAAAGGGEPAAVAAALCAARPPYELPAEALALYIRDKHWKLQAEVIEFFESRPDLRTPVEISTSEHRDLCMKQLQALVREANIRPFRYLLEDPEKYFAVTTAIGSVDASLGIKMGVQYSLWGGSVMNLGTQRHKDEFFDGIDNLDFPGCFAMTELHHGSNVQALQTTATFDAATDEFIMHTPNDGAIKWWIGNAAVHGKFATVFARLVLPGGGGDKGIHAFIVPLRDLSTHAPLPGVEIRDCGHKLGLNGVDNGAIKFSHVRIPRRHLLNRFADVSPSGEYTSPLPSPSKRFAAVLGELVGGRVGLAHSSAAILKLGAAIAVRYSLLRRQFGPAAQAEVAILDYPSQQGRLMPMLAAAYAFHFATGFLVERYAGMRRKEGGEEVVGEVHALSAGLKAYVTAYTAKALSVCREACGGHGYAAVNRLGALRSDHDIFQTFEGDNTVLLQQVAADLLKRYNEKFKGTTLSVTYTYLRESMVGYFSQPNPITSRWEREDHLRDPKFQLDAFRYRTSRLLQTAAMRLHKHTKTLGNFGGWNRCLNHLLTLAESHIETVILEKFIDAVDRCPDAGTRTVLKLVCDLYALDRIWSDIGSFRNVDYLAPNKAKAIHKLRDQLCAEVREVAGELVNAFDLAAHTTRAPIAMQAEAYSTYTRQVGFNISDSTTTPI
ncbi:acyl-CoA oxidase 2 [Wolffia australiana]